MTKKFFHRSDGERDWIQVSLAAIFFLILAIIIVGVYWLAFDDNPPGEVFEVTLYDIDDLENVVDSVTILPGGGFAYGMDWCKYTTAAKVIIKSSWQNDTVVPVPPFPPTVADEPFCKEWTVMWTAPSTLLPSVYTLNVTLEYEINPLISRNITYEVPGINVIAELEE